MADFASAASADTLWTMVAACFVFMMHAGFGLLEAGCVRTKNHQAILFKGMFTICIAAVVWELIGFGIAFGPDGNKFIGGGLMAPGETDLSKDGGYIFYFFQWTFCATTGTIVSGAAAERIHLLGYAIITTYLTAFVYPVVVHWSWYGGGWLYTHDDTGFADFAGSGVVHMCGGFAALAVVTVLGPRLGRFKKPNKLACCIRAENWSAKNAEMASQKFLNNFSGESALSRPTSPILVFLGTFLLWFGWYGFNAGSFLGVTHTPSPDDGTLSDRTVGVGRAVSVTMLGGSLGGLGYVIFNLILSLTCCRPEDKKKFTVAGFANGILGGLVGITAGCNSLNTGTAMLSGFIGGIVVDLATRLEAKLGIDDVVGAWPVHGACGMWGLIANGLFHQETGAISGTEDVTCFDTNMIGMIVIGLWAFFTVLPVALVLNVVGLLRVDVDTEIAGQDEEFHSVNYPRNGDFKVTPKHHGSVEPAA